MKKIALLAFLSSLLLSTNAIARDQIKTVGSSTVFPFATVAAENFGKSSEFNKR